MNHARSINPGLRFPFEQIEYLQAIFDASLPGSSEDEGEEGDDEDDDDDEAAAVRPAAIDSTLPLISELPVVVHDYSEY